MFVPQGLSHMRVDPTYYSPCGTNIFTCRNINSLKNLKLFLTDFLLLVFLIFVDDKFSNKFPDPAY